MVDIPPQPWPTGLAEQVEPLVRRVLAPNPSPYTFTGTETYIVGAGSEVAVIDPGPAGTGEAGHADTNGQGHVGAIRRPAESCNRRADYRLRTAGPRR
jgi:hypothetical protein